MYLFCQGYTVIRARENTASFPSLSPYIYMWCQEFWQPLGDITNYNNHFWKSSLISCFRSYRTWIFLLPISLSSVMKYNNPSLPGSHHQSYHLVHTVSSASLMWTVFPDLLSSCYVIKLHIALYYSPFENPLNLESYPNDSPGSETLENLPLTLVAVHVFLLTHSLDLAH